MFPLSIHKLLEITNNIVSIHELVLGSLSGQSIIMCPNKVIKRKINKTKKDYRIQLGEL
jgi:hypothetical protein